MKSFFGKAMLMSIIAAGLIKMIRKIFDVNAYLLYQVQIFLLAASLISALVLMFIIYINNKSTKTVK